MSLMTIRAAVDGSALGNPGPAGWAWVVSPTCWDAGGWDHGTNNLGELTAVLELLRATESAGLAGEPLHVLADSQYAINVITKWMHGWKKKGWVKTDKKPIANLEVIQEIDRLIAGRQVTFEWVRGHTGHPMNERADDLARSAAETHQKGGVASGGPGFSGASAPNDASSPNCGAHMTDQTGFEESSTSTPSSLAPSTPPTSTATTSAADMGARVCIQDDSADFEAPDALDSQPGALIPATSSPSALPCLTRSEVLAAQKAIITAWTSALPDEVTPWLAPGFERIWPNGSVTDTFYGPCPPHLSVSRIHTRTAGSTMITRFELSWGTGRSVETGLWIPGEDGPRLLHHQSTIVSSAPHSAGAADSSPGDR
ncbi:ribonuclease H [Schaalia sp. Marseille-Q2122]|uniref:ribonuclease H family protein n=1 Tax=Schaalia sp. Marseille-Q2122 TaxID=2736604 RepID=UPI0020CA889E|nr:ribonuclease H [Schaalia sp. Marseille-Q2122]